MSNKCYDVAIDSTFGRLIDWATGQDSSGNPMKVIALNSSYSFNTTDQHLSDIVSGDRVTAGIAISTPSFTGRLFKFAPFLFPAVTNGATISSVVLYIDTGTESTSKLLVFCDTGLDLPITGTGADISCTPDQTLGLFSL